MYPVIRNSSKISMQGYRSMLDTVEEIASYIREITESDYRDSMVAKSQVTASAIRVGGILDDEFSLFSETDRNLISYAYAVLDLGLRLYELDASADESRLAFEASASALESVLTKIDCRDEQNKFIQIMAASSYHLARYSARASCLVSFLVSSEELTLMEKILVNLMCRNITRVRDDVLMYRISDKGSDKSISNLINSELSNGDKESADEGKEDLLMECINISITDSYCSSMSMFVLGVERGEKSLIEEAKYTLKIGLGVCNDLNLVSQWWIHRISIHLIGDLWANTYHEKLPDHFVGSDSTEWAYLRELFIAISYRKKRSEIDLWPSQVKAAKRAIDQNDDLVVSLPTSSGKTRIAEICILRCVSERRRVIFVTPLRALAAQTERTLKSVFNLLGKPVSRYYDGSGFGYDERKKYQNYDILIMTPEKLDFAVRYDKSILDDVGLLVFDEGHMINLDMRGIQYESLIQRLLRRPDAHTRRIVCLSAVLPDGNGIDDFVNWIRGDQIGSPVEVDWQPTQQRFGEVIWQDSHAKLLIHADKENREVENYITGFVPPSYSPPRGRRYKMFPRGQRELCIAVAWKLIEQDQIVLIYCPRRDSVERIAENIVELYDREALKPISNFNESDVESATSIGCEWFGSNSGITKCLRLGVGVHHAGLPKSYLREMERLIENRKIKAIITSPTLAQGVNLPVTSVVFNSIYRYNKSKKRTHPIDPIEFRNVVGRAGRAHVDSQGVVLYPMFDKINKKETDWNSLVDSDKSYRLESCLVKLVANLLNLMSDLVDNEIFEEYVSNSTYDWDSFDREFENIGDADRRKEWKDHLSMLDTMILSLIGDRDLQLEDIASALDGALRSSLWNRYFEHHTRENEREYREVILSRCRYAWNRVSSRQRKNYFFMGVGFDVGQMLDKVEEDVRMHMKSFGTRIKHGDYEDAAETLIDIAKIIFKIFPFEKKYSLKEWKKTASAWFLGNSIYEVEYSEDSDVSEFIENEIIFKLSWVIDMFERRLARDLETDIEGIPYGDNDMYELASNAAKCGTFNMSASILIRMGFDIRSAAIKAAVQTKANFVNEDGFRIWLKSSEVTSAATNPNWPTRESHDLWRRFYTDMSINRNSVWVRERYFEPVMWRGKKPDGDVPLQIYDKEGCPFVLSKTGEIVGTLFRATDPKRIGLTLVRSIYNSDKVFIRYIGPDRLWAPR